MPVSSLLFVHLFLPAFLLAYWATPRVAKNYVAIAASLLFYAWGAPRFLPVVLGLGLIDFWVSDRIAGAAGRGKKLLLAAVVTMHLSVLVYFKYTNFFVGELNAALSHLGFAPFS